MLKTVNCPLCHKAIEVECQETESETSKRLKRQTCKLRADLDAKERALSHTQAALRSAAAENVELRAKVVRLEMYLWEWQEQENTRKREKKHCRLWTYIFGGSK